MDWLTGSGIVVTILYTGYQVYRDARKGKTQRQSVPAPDETLKITPPAAETKDDNNDGKAVAQVRQIEVHTDTLSSEQEATLKALYAYAAAGIDRVIIAEIIKLAPFAPNEIELFLEDLRERGYAGCQFTTSIQPTEYWITTAGTKYARERLLTK